MARRQRARADPPRPAPARRPWPPQTRTHQHTNDSLSPPLSVSRRHHTNRLTRLSTLTRLVVHHSACDCRRPRPGTPGGLGPGIGTDVAAPHGPRSSALPNTVGAKQRPEWRPGPSRSKTGRALEWFSRFPNNTKSAPRRSHVPRQEALLLPVIGPPSGRTNPRAGPCFTTLTADSDVVKVGADENRRPRPRRPMPQPPPPAAAARP